MEKPTPLSFRPIVLYYQSLGSSSALRETPRFAFESLRCNNEALEKIELVISRRRLRCENGGLEEIGASRSRDWSVPNDVAFWGGSRDVLIRGHGGRVDQSWGPDEESIDFYTNGPHGFHQ